MRENERNERWMLILSHTAHPLYYVLHSPDALPASPDALPASVTRRPLVAGHCFFPGLGFLFFHPPPLPIVGMSQPSLLAAQQQQQVAMLHNQAAARMIAHAFNVSPAQVTPQYVEDVRTALDELLGPSPDEDLLTRLRGALASQSTDAFPTNHSGTN